jgi:hypothetical protein
MRVAEGARGSWTEMAGALPARPTVAELFNLLAGPI